MAAFVGTVLFCTSSYGNTYIVTTTNDTGPGSLRAVITEANGVAGPNTITFANSGNLAGGGTIGCISPLPEITQSATIAGWGNTGATTNAIAITGSPLVFGPGTSNSLQQLNIAGSITNGQSLSLTGCVITNGGIQSTNVLQVISSSIIGSPTAGIWNSGNATLNGVTISLCNVGGIYNGGIMTIGDSTITSNTSSTGGGGIYSTNSLQVVGCQIVGNSARSFGGGIFNSGTAVILQSTIVSNEAFPVAVSAVNSYGGGIFNTGSLVLNQTSVANNFAIGQGYPMYGDEPLGSGFGGGVYTTGHMEGTNTTFSGNEAIGGPGELIEPDMPSYGSAICVITGNVQLINCTVAYNWAQGGGSGDGFAAVYNSAGNIHSLTHWLPLT